MVFGVVKIYSAGFDGSFVGVFWKSWVVSIALYIVFALMGTINDLVSGVETFTLSVCTWVSPMNRLSMSVLVDSGLV